MVVLDTVQGFSVKEMAIQAMRPAAVAVVPIGAILEPAWVAQALMARSRSLM
ncbi:MAG: hypothetical protein KDB75_07610 [Flavobacteriales bacterium]|nr:hypothetical protein [Flavobacteriales bacterium]